jgi:molybdopterin molybdotransferase
MPEFLQLVSSSEASQKLFQNLPPAHPAAETIPTIEALGRVTSRPVFSPEPSPAFSRSTVDGYALVARDTHGASDTQPMYLNVVGEVPMGNAPTFSIKSGQAAVIHTGGMLPQGSDAVIMIENTQFVSQTEIELMKPITSAENVVLKGEDVQSGQEVLPAGKQLRPADIGGLLALGLTRVTVTSRPRVGILSSGDEVIPPDQSPRIGQVRDINSYDLSALVQQYGGNPLQYGILPDQPEALEKAVQKALSENDLVVITAGSSASVRDLTAEAIQKAGAPGVLVHGIHIRPGKPTILAVCDGKPVVGLPGNPVSALVIAYRFVAPLVRYLSGLTPFAPQPFVPARLSVNLPSLAGREEWIPVKLLPTDSGYDASPVFFKSSLIFNLAWADGLVCIPADANGLETGAPVQVILF